MRCAALHYAVSASDDSWRVTKSIRLVLQMMIIMGVIGLAIVGILVCKYSRFARNRCSPRL